MQGMAGNYRIASELMLRGLNVYFPAIDIGVDLLVEGCVRIQVKSAHISTHHRYDKSGRPVYAFRLTKTKFLGNRVLRAEARNFSEVCDFVVLWGIEQNRFWIVPADLLNGRFSIVVGQEDRWVQSDIDTIKRLHAEGKTNEQIGQQLGMATMTVWRRTQGMFVDNPSPLIHRIKNCEGRWDLIESCLDTLTEATQQTVADASLMQDGSPAGQ